jgi:DNA-binding IclR family transcriptional regulator
MRISIPAAIATGGLCAGWEERVSTSDRLLSVLDLFDLEQPDWSVDEAAAVLGLATSTTYRYFASLTARGLLAPFANARYVLGPTIIRYDRQLRLTDPLISAAESELQRLARLEPGRTVAFLCRLLGGQVMCVQQASVGDPSFAVGYERGRLMPLFAGSASKVILAHLPPRQLRAHYGREPAAFSGAKLGTSWDEVRATLRAIRDAGYAVSTGEVDPGMRGVSVPLVDQANAVIASVNVAGPQRVLDSSTVERLAKGLRKAAVGIAKELALMASSRSARR